VPLKNSAASKKRLSFSPIVILPAAKSSDYFTETDNNNINLQAECLEEKIKNVPQT